MGAPKKAIDDAPASDVLPLVKKRGGRFPIDMWREYVAAYNAALVEWLRGEDLAACRAHWRKHMKLRDQLVEANLPLVKKLVQKITRKSTAITELDDLMQHGAIGLLRALDPVKGFDASRGFAFSTYANHWIRHFVQVSQGEQSPIRRPHGSGVPYQTWLKQEEIEGRTGRQATAEELGCTQEQLDKWRSDGIVFGSLDVNWKDTASGKASSPNDGVCTLHDVVPTEVPNAEQSYSSAELGDLLREGLADLDPRARRILEALYVEGLGNKEVARREGISEEYLRQIRNAAIAELQEVLEWP